MDTVLTVSQITTYIRSLLDGDPNLDPVYLCGEISNFNAYQKSGHWYFSLKDANAVLRCVMFRSANQRLRFCPENGMRVLIRGRISVYERDGTYQLYAEDMLPDGAGALAVAFEQLRRRLEQVRGRLPDCARGVVPPDLVEDGPDVREGNLPRVDPRPVRRVLPVDLFNEGCNTQGRSKRKCCLANGGNSLFCGLWE